MTTSYMPLEYFSRALVLSCNLDEITIFKGKKKKKSWRYCKRECVCKDSVLVTTDTGLLGFLY